MAGSKASIEAGKGHVTLSVDKSALQVGLDAARAAVQSFGKGLAVVGAGISAVGAAITAPFLKGLQVFAAWGAETKTAIRETGISFAELQGITGGLRVSTEELVPAVAHMSSFLAQAAQGGQEANRQLSDLNLTMDEFQHLTQAQRIERFADALGAIGDQGRRIAAQRAIFGRGGLELNFEGGRAGMQARASRQAEVYGTRTQGDFQSANAYNMAVKEMTLATSGLWASIGAAAAPAMTSFFQLVTNAVIIVRQWVDANQPLLDTIFRVADACVLAGTIIGVLGGIVYAASYAFTALGGVTLVSTAISLAWSAAQAIAYGVAAGAVLLYQGVVLVASAIIGGVWTTALLIAGAAVLGFKLLVWGLNFATAALDAVVAFAAGGFGLYTIASWAAWLATLAVKAATWLASLAMGGYSVAATVATGATTAATGGINLLAAGLAVLVVVAIAAAVAIGGFIALLPLLAFGGLLYALNVFHMIWEVVKGIGSAIGVVASAITNNFMAAVSMIGDLFMEAASNIGAAFGRAFDNIVSYAGTAFSALKDAMAVGDLELIWEVVKTAAQLAWLDIYDVAIVTWANLKGFVLGAMAEVGSAIAQTFSDVWYGVKAVFVSVWGEVKALAFEGIAQILRGLAAIAPTNDAAKLLREQAAGYGMDARLAREGATRQNNADAENAATERLVREAELWQEMQQIQADMQAAQDTGNDAERAALQERLDYLKWFAEFEKDMAALDAGGAPTAGSAESGFAGGKTSVYGSFSAAALMGALGSQTVSPAERQLQATMQALREQQEANRIARAMLEVLAGNLPLEFGA